MSATADYNDRLRREPLRDRLLAVAAKEHLDVHVHSAFADQSPQKLFGETGRCRRAVQRERVWNNPGNEQFERRAQVVGKETGNPETCPGCFRTGVDHMKPELRTFCARRRGRKFQFMNTCHALSVRVVTLWAYQFQLGSHKENIKMEIRRLSPARRNVQNSNRSSMTLLSRAIRFVSSLAGVLLVTWAGSSLVPVNATTIGFAYLLLVLVIATVWGFLEALVASILATLCFNFFFLPPVGRFTIAEPQNWIALFSFWFRCELLLP
jgi:hypothetical protein